MFLSDLQTVAFWNLKNAKSIAAIEPFPKKEFRLTSLVISSACLSSYHLYSPVLKDDVSGQVQGYLATLITPQG
jgi:hypothetical protein